MKSIRSTLVCRISECTAMFIVKQISQMFTKIHEKTWACVLLLVFNSLSSMKSDNSPDQRSNVLTISVHNSASHDVGARLPTTVATNVFSRVCVFVHLHAYRTQYATNTRSCFKCSQTEYHCFWRYSSRPVKLDAGD